MNNVSNVHKIVNSYIGSYKLGREGIMSYHSIYDNYNNIILIRINMNSCDFERLGMTPNKFWCIERFVILIPTTRVLGFLIR